ncbi:hypothetical protein EVAR_55238_1 [Eumeta japonica]|uniref:Uncharacterized protein n=1 Tax=Eumeta variegata TaxID=151549 RepID=A0A4C1Y8X9_EUMVA|nr:hypothetical protein EVAR_55238_1 [Eumeta japonica]
MGAVRCCWKVFESWPTSRFFGGLRKKGGGVCAAGYAVRNRFWICTVNVTDSLLMVVICLRKLLENVSCVSLIRYVQCNALMSFVRYMGCSMNFISIELVSTSFSSRVCAQPALEGSRPGTKRQSERTHRQCGE